MAGGYSGAVALAPRRRRNHRGLCRSHNPWWSRRPDCRLPLRQGLHKLGTAADSLLAGADESEQRRTPTMPNLCLCTGRMPTTVRPTVAHASMPTRSMRPARSARSLSATRRLARRYRNGDGAGVVEAQRSRLQCHDLDRQGHPARAIAFAQSERRTGAVRAGTSWQRCIGKRIFRTPTVSPAIGERRGRRSGTAP